MKPGGVLVYSTCSLTTRQNELVIARFLGEFGDHACLEQVWLPEHVSDARPCHRPEIHCAIPSWDRLVRIEPWKHQMSGMFIAKIRKLALK